VASGRGDFEIERFQIGGHGCCTVSLYPWLDLTAGCRMPSMRFLALSLALAALPAMAAEYPLWDGEPIEEYAKMVGLPPTKTIDLGDGVTMDFLLIPAGKFMMGTREPDPVDDEEKYLEIHKWIGIGASLIGGGVLLAIAASVIARAIRDRARPQVSLWRLLAMALMASVGVLGGLHWWHSDKALWLVKAEYKAAKARSADYMQPAHNVTISRPFYMGKYEVTQEQHQQVMGKSPSWFKGRPDLPVEMVSWEDARDFCSNASAKTGLVLRLPSEAEWEFACRAGTVTDYHSGDDEPSLDRAGWCYHPNTSKLNTHPVGQKEANRFGLHDMHGNVWEWCEDDWHNGYEGAPVDGSAWVDEPRGAQRVLRGGSWGNGPSLSRSIERNGKDSDYSIFDLGFRVVVAAPEADHRPHSTSGGEVTAQKRAE